MLIGLDPGTSESAYFLWDGKRPVAWGKIPNQQLLSDLYAYRHRCMEHNPDRLVIEMVQSMGMAVGQSIFDTCVWIGRFIEAFGVERCSRVYRREVKLHICGTSKANDSTIRTALIDRFGAPGTKKKPGFSHGITADAWQAFALAVTWWDQYGERLYARNPEPAEAAS